MPPTSSSTWKRRERQAAALFGAKRQRLSGSSGREDESTSDSTHPLLYMETKTRAKHAARTLYDETKIAAKKEGKLAVLALATKGRKGTLICVHSDDLIEFARITLESAPPVSPPPAQPGDENARAFARLQKLQKPAKPPLGLSEQLSR